MAFLIGGGDALPANNLTSSSAPVTDNVLARYDGITGFILQDSLVTVADTTGTMTFLAAGDILWSSDGVASIGGAADNRPASVHALTSMTIGGIVVVNLSSAQALTNKTIDGDLNTVSNLAHGAEVDSPTSGVHGAVGTIVGTSDAQVLTNKTLDGDLNTVSNMDHGAEVDNPSSGVHGVTGSVVGTTDSQSLTNKTIDGSLNTISNIDHGGLLGLSDDDHSGYALLVGRAGGQTLIGGTGAGEDLTLTSTSHGTKGDIFIPSGQSLIPLGTDVDLGVSGSSRFRSVFLRTHLGVSTSAGFNFATSNVIRAIAGNNEVARFNTSGLQIDATALTGIVFETDGTGSIGEAADFRPGSIHAATSITIGGVAVVDLSSAQALTNKTFDADSNTLSNVDNADIKAAAAIALNKLAATTVSRALVSDGSGFVSPATTTAAEIGHVNGVTSAIQTQLDAKADDISSRVEVQGHNGYGSTNTAIPRFDSALVNVGSGITYADSATLGASFTIDETGVYLISYHGVNNAGTTQDLGISLNTSAPTDNIGTITAADRLGLVKMADSTSGSLTVIRALSATNVIRPHTSKGNFADIDVRFTIVKLSG